MLVVAWPVVVQSFTGQDIWFGSVVMNSSFGCSTPMSNQYIITTENAIKANVTVTATSPNHVVDVGCCCGCVDPSILRRFSSTAAASAAVVLDGGKGLLRSSAAVIVVVAVAVLSIAAVDGVDVDADDDNVAAAVAVPPFDDVDEGDASAVVAVVTAASVNEFTSILVFLAVGRPATSLNLLR